MFSFAFYLVCFIMSYLRSTAIADETLVEMLKKKVIGLDESLTMDIRLLRKDMEKNSNELSHLSTLLEDTLETLKAVEFRPIGDSGPRTKQLEGTHVFERTMDRVKRAFAEEKMGLKKFTSRLKTEIDQLSSEINTALSDFGVSHLDGVIATNKNMESFKESLTQAMADLTSNLIGSVEKMSFNLATEINQAVSSMKETTKHMEVLSHNVSENHLETSEQIKEIREQVGAFDDKFDQINEVLGILKAKVNVYSYDDVRLVNITQTATEIGGRLEVKYDGNWGTVCDDQFDINDAKVACRMLGLSGAVSVKDQAFYGQGVGVIFLDDLSCSGTEASLYFCGHTGSGEENCGHSEDVGVICNY